MATGDAYSLRNYAGSAPEVHLNGSIGTTDASFALQAGEGSGWPTANFPAIIDYDNGSAEKIYVGARSGVNLSGVVRGVDDTTQKTHTNGAKIRHVAFKQDFVEANAIAAALTTKGDSLWKGVTPTVAPARLAAGSDQQIIRYLAANALGVETTWVGSLPVFVSAAARNAAIAAPSAGQGCYLDTGDTLEGPYYYNGTAWRLPWNVSWGEVARATSNVATAGITADADVMTATFTAVANRRYRIMAHVLTLQVTTGGTQFLKITDNTPTTLQTCQRTVAAASVETLFAFAEVSPSAGSVTYRARISTNAGTLTLQGSGTAQVHYLTIEDVGPSGAPT